MTRESIFKLGCPILAQQGWGTDDSPKRFRRLNPSPTLSYGKDGGPVLPSLTRRGWVRFFPASITPWQGGKKEKEPFWKQR